jgi:hypothetical protein
VAKKIPAGSALMLQMLDAERRHRGLFNDAARRLPELSIPCSEIDIPSFRFP